MPIPAAHIVFRIADGSYEEFRASLFNLIRKGAATNFVRYDGDIQIALETEENKRLLCLMRRGDLYVCTFGATDRMHRFTDVNGIPETECYTLGCDSSYGGMLPKGLKECGSWARFTIAVKSLIDGLKPRNYNKFETIPVSCHMARVVLVIAEGVRFRIVAKAFEDSKRCGRYNVSDYMLSLLNNSWDKLSECAKHVDVDIMRTNLTQQEQLVLNLVENCKNEEASLLKMLRDTFPRVCAVMLSVRCNHLNPQHYR